MYSDILAISKEAFAFISGDPAGYPDGRHALGGGVYVSITRYDSKPRSAGKYEAHRNYIDIQVVLEGQEIIAVEPLAVMQAQECIAPYNPEKDVELYVTNDLGEDHILNPGDYRILLPEDAHMPGIAVDAPAPVRKAVIKVPV